MSNQVQTITIDGQQVRAIVIESDNKIYTAVCAEYSHKVSADRLFTEKSKQT